MANLDNNYENENSKEQNESIPKKVGKAVEEAKELAKDAIENPVEVAGEFAQQAGKDVTSVKWWMKLILYVFWIGLSLIIAILIAINLNVTKQWAARKALEVLNQDFKAKMTTQSIHVDYFGDVTVKGLTIKDYKGMDFIKAREFRANSDWLSLLTNVGKNNALSFNSLQLTNADVKVITYEGDSISNFVRYLDNFQTGKPSDPNRPPFQLNSRVELVDSKVSIINRNKAGDEGRWLVATGVNLLAPAVKVNGSNVSAQVNNLSFTTTRYGKTHYVDTFSTEIAMTKDYLSLKDLTFNTSHSLLQGDLKFNLNNGSWQDFADKVRLEINLMPGSQLSGYDLGYFMTSWDNPSTISLSGELSGPLNNFYLEDFVLGNRNVNIATTTMRLRNLLKGNFLIETNNVSTDFTYRDLKAMLPSFIALKMKNFADDFGRLRYTGALRVTPQQIYVPRARLLTGVGQARLQNFYLENYSSPSPKYRGFAEVNDLNAAVITKMPQVGLISGRINFQGQSFDVNQMVIRTKASIDRIQILGRTLTNLQLDGLLNKKTYDGLIRISDPQAMARVEGLIDFRTSVIKADINAAIERLNLSFFTGASSPQIISGNIVGKISMSSLNDLQLNADVSALRFMASGSDYQIPSANVKIYTQGGVRVAEVDAPGALRGRIAGNYRLGDLAGMVQNGLGRILVGPPPRTLYRGQSFNMEFSVEQGLANFFLPDLKIPQGARVSGSYEGTSNDLVLNVEAAQLVYRMKNKKQYTQAEQVLSDLGREYSMEDVFQPDENVLVDNVVVRINTAELDEQIFARVDRIQLNEQVVKDLVLTGRNENNQRLHLSTNFLHGTREQEIAQELKSYAINLNQTTNSRGDYVVQFEPTEIKIGSVAWRVDTSPELGHSITYRKGEKDFFIENLRLYSDESSVLLKQATFKSAKDFFAEGSVQNLQIAKLLEMQTGGNSMDIQGVANGEFAIRMNQSNLEPLIDLSIAGITMNGEDMGTVILEASKSGRANVFDVNARVESAGIMGGNSLLVQGTVDNNTPTPTLDIQADMKDFDLAFTQEFVKGVFGNMRGKANGILSISGPLNNIDYSGDIALSDFGMRLNFTGVDYEFEDTVIPLSRGLAVLNEVRLKDGRSNSGGTISGVIQFETLASMAVNLIMRADNLMVLNTQQKDYDLFWGRVYGQGNLYVSGPVSGLSIATDLNEPFRALNNSVFTFNAGSTSGVDEFKMLRFLKENQSGEIVIEERPERGTGMALDFNIAVDKGTTVNVMLPEDVGSITVRGEANPLRFRMFPNGNITMNGSYIVDNGTFVSRAILERTFQITRGSSMRWDGDAMTPALDITANYMRAVTNAGQYLGVSTLPPINVLLAVNITGTLNDPEIALGVSAPDLSSQLKETLAGKMMNEDEKVIQFGSVLVMNSFNVANSGGFDLNVGSTLENSGYNILFKQLGSVFNTISNEVQVDLNFLKGDQASNTGDRANASVSIALSPRVTVKTGLGVPLSRGSEGTSYNYLSGEGIIEYDWSKKNDGTRLFRAYSKPSNIGLVAGNANTSANQSYGVGVVYSKSFNTIFKRKKKKPKADSTAIKIDSAKIDTVK